MPASIEPRMAMAPVTNSTEALIKPSENCPSANFLPLNRFMTISPTPSRKRSICKSSPIIAPSARLTTTHSVLFEPTAPCTPKPTMTSPIAAISVLVNLSFILPRNSVPSVPPITIPTAFIIAAIISLSPLKRNEIIIKFATKKVNCLL